MKKCILSFVLGVIITSGVVYAIDILIPATSISYSSEYTESDNVADALDELLTPVKPTKQLIGTYTGNQTVDITSFMSDNISVNDFIIEIISIPEKKNSIVEPVNAGTYTYYSQLDATTVSKSINDNQLIISGMVVNCSGGMHLKSWNVTSAVNIKYNLYYAP